MLIQEAFGLVLKEERKKMGLSQEKFAELTDLSRNYIYYLEAGKKNPSLSIFYTISVALGIKAEVLMAMVCDKMVHIE